MQQQAVKLTAIQIISSDCIDHNFAQITAQLDRLPALTSEQHHLVLLPENALCFANRTDYLEVAEVLGSGPVQKRLSALAREYQCTLVCGSFPIQSPQSDKIYTTSLVYSAQGELISHYHKMHLFDADVADSQAVYRESDTFIPGQGIQVVDCGFATIGLAICYDLRFPALFQQLVKAGAEVILLPAAFTKVTGEAHWQPLLQARAIETQCYFVAANQGGEHFVDHAEFAPRNTYGHSMIIDPWGEILAQTTLGNEVVQANFERERLQTIRQKMPVQQHSRFICTQKNK